MEKSNVKKSILKKSKSKLAFVTLILMGASFAVVQATPSGAQPHATKNKKEDVVYVCACLGTKSCACMTESKTEGPCSCGTQGGPPLKAVARDSSWAKENRDALATKD